MAREKDESYWKILCAAMELDVKKGHLKWTLSDLSRKTDITRSLIYYYFGKEKMEILDEAVKLIGHELAGLNSERNELWQKGQFFESLLQARGVMEKAHTLPSFYFEHYNRETEIGNSLRKIEKEFKEKLSRFFVNMSEADQELLYTIYWGICFTPKISEAAMHGATDLIQKCFLEKESLG